MTSREPYVMIDAVTEHFSVSRSTIRAWIRQGVIPSNTYIKVGTTYRFKISAIECALSGNEAEDTQIALDLDCDDNESELPILD